jgi:glutamate dehydrogenase/leucine dehydrogenase
VEELKAQISEMDLTLKQGDGCHIFTAVHNGNTLGYVAIDATIHGRSCGGLRMLPDIDEAEIQALAHSMTLKFGRQD